MYFTDETTSGVSYPVLASPVQGRHGHTGLSPVKEREDDYGLRTSAKQGESWVSSEWRSFRGILPVCINYLTGWM